MSSWETAELCPLQLAPTVRNTTKGPRIEGYAAVFYRADDPGTEFELFPGLIERIDRGAFEGRTADPVAVVFNHDQNELIGRVPATAELRVRSRGLFYSVDASSSVGQRVAESIRRGDVDGSSFRFELAPEGGVEYSDGPKDSTIRTIKRVRKLWDVGPVVYPAFASSTAVARSRGDLLSARRSAVSAARTAGGAVLADLTLALTRLALAR